MKKSAALLMGILIVSIIMVVAISVAADSLHALVSGTNVADYELAHQAAESGMENAILYLLRPAPPESGGFTHDELIGGYVGCQADGSGCDHTRPITGPCDSWNNPANPSCNPAWPTKNEPTDEKSYYFQRDMTIAGDVGDPSYYRKNIGTQPDPPNPSHQYWNYKIWRDPGGSGSGSADDWFPAETSGSINGPAAIIFQKSETSPACDKITGACLDSNNFVNNEGQYSVNLRITFSGTPAVHPDAMSIRYWFWADDNNAMCLSSGVPVDCSTSQLIAETGSSELDWEAFRTSGFNLAALVNATPIIGNYWKNFHIYYVVDKEGASISGPGISTVTNRVLFGRDGYMWDLTDYVIDVVGMYGKEKVKLRAVFNPITMKFWRINAY